jgi:hypothetical protein
MMLPYFDREFEMLLYCVRILFESLGGLSDYLSE